MDNRQRLLDCALDLFSQRGYEAVAVREVVAGAGVTKPTLYHYFNSKRGLLDALLRRETALLISRLKSAATYQGDLVLTIEKIVSTYFDFARLSGNSYRLMLTMYFAPPESESNQAIKPYTHQQHDILGEVFLQAVEDHGNFRGRHRRYAASLWGAINAMIGLNLNDQIDLNDEVVYQTVHQFMHGIFS